MYLGLKGKTNKPKHIVIVDHVGGDEEDDSLSELEVSVNNYIFISM